MRERQVEQPRWVAEVVVIQLLKYGNSDKLVLIKDENLILFESLPSQDQLGWEMLNHIFVFKSPPILLAPREASISFHCLELGQFLYAKLIHFFNETSIELKSLEYGIILLTHVGVGVCALQFLLLAIKIG